MPMRLETLLPLGKVDPGLRAPQTGLDLAAVAADAALIEELGYDGVAIEETKQDPYVVLALAAQATARLRVSTAIAMAFPRSPTITAMSAWTLQRLAKGRFTLGLGPQVRAHIERRYGLAWSAPGPWMREYVGAVRAIWRCWQQQQPLEVKGPHYRLNLMPPLFDPRSDRASRNSHPSRRRQRADVPSGGRGRRRGASAPDLLGRLHCQCHAARAGQGCPSRRPLARDVQDLPQAAGGDGGNRRGACLARRRRARQACLLSFDPQLPGRGLLPRPGRAGAPAEPARPRPGLGKNARLRQR